MQLTLFKRHNPEYRKIWVLALIYFLAAKFGLSLAYQTDQVTTIWPAAGIALGALLIFGRRLWPGIALGSFAANLLTNETFFTAFGIAATNTAASYLAAYLLQERLHFRNNLSRLRDVTALVVAPVFGSTLISSTLGVLNLSVSSVISWSNFYSVWLTWWVGDLMGILIFAPLILAWSNQELVEWGKSKRVEFALFYTTLIFFASIVFLSSQQAGPIAYLILPFIVYSGLRLRPIGAATTNFIIVIIAVLGTIASRGPFTQSANMEANLILLLAYIFVFAVTSLLLAAAIEERERAHETIHHQTYHDALTGLHNRFYFFEQVNQILTQKPDSSYVLFKINLDRFKVINDSLGYSLGDRLLSEIGGRIKEAMDSKGFFARLDGDEFIAFLDQNQNEKLVKQTAEQILESLKSPFLLDEHELYVTASIGISLFPNDGTDASELLRNARSALCRAKEMGRSNYQFYSDSLDTTSFRDLNLETDLRRALQKDELTVYYEPQVNLNSGKISKLEALVRWRHPKRGLIMPSEFIDLAEATGLIDEICDFVLNTAIGQVAWWHSIGARVGIAVNLSSRQFHQEDFAKKIRNFLYKYSLPPQFLDLEVTERSLLLDASVTRKIMEELKDIGVKICIDDFHTGHSSLNYIKQFPFDILKIDRSFVAGIPENRNDVAIAESIIQLAHVLKKEVTAEGVENKKQLKFLISHECDHVQGYLFSKPLSAEDCVEFLKQKVPDIRSLVTN